MAQGEQQQKIVIKWSNLVLLVLTFQQVHELSLIPTFLF